MPELEADQVLLTERLIAWRWVVVEACNRLLEARSSSTNEVERDWLAAEIMDLHRYAGQVPTFH